MCTVCREISGRFSGNLQEISGKSSGIRKRENDITQRQNKFLINGLYENDPTIMPDSPVEYLRKCNFTPMSRLFPTRFKFQNHENEISKSDQYLYLS